LYQWGRGNDGHQIVTYTSSTVASLTPSTTTLSNVDNPNNNIFIKSLTDWRNPNNNNLWQGVNGINNPCPNGFRLPTQTEFNNEITTYSLTNTTHVYNVLRMPLTGSRVYNTAAYQVPTYLVYWTSTNNNTQNSIYFTHFGTSVFTSGITIRAYGFAVRCIKD
jgi:uncharacterized protein (TIGR02145 family)